MKGFALAVVFALSSSGAGVESSIVGTYTCTGTRGPQAYTLRLVVHPFGETYQLVWTADQGQAAIGLGVRDGDAVAVTLVSPGGELGVAHYVISPGRLAGVWSTGDGRVHREVCTQGQPT